VGLAGAAGRALQRPHRRWDRAAENFPAGGEHDDVGTSGEHGVGKSGRGLDDVLAVVEHKQQPAAPQMVTEALLQRLSRLGERAGK